MTSKPKKPKNKPNRIGNIIRKSPSNMKSSISNRRSHIMNKINFYNNTTNNVSVNHRTSTRSIPMKTFLFTLKVRNFQFNGVKVSIHIFIIPHVTEIHIPPSPIWSGPDSLASRCKIIVIFTRICNEKRWKTRNKTEANISENNYLTPR